MYIENPLPVIVSVLLTVVLLVALGLNAHWLGKSQAIARAAERGTLVSRVPTDAEQQSNELVLRQVGWAWADFREACKYGADVQPHLDRRDALRTQLRYHLPGVWYLPRRTQALALKDWQCGWPGTTWKHHSRP